MKAAKQYTAAKTTLFIKITCIEHPFRNRTSTSSILPSFVILQLLCYMYD